MCSDHFYALERAAGRVRLRLVAGSARRSQATALPFGVVNAPGQRYHPAIIAQAAATLAEMFPGRFWVALGTGEASNEHITGDRWPAKAERNARLRECVDVMRALFAGEDGRPRRARARRPRAAVDAAGRAAAAGRRGGERGDGALGGGWADGLITIDQPRDAAAAGGRRVPRGRRRRQAGRTSRSTFAGRRRGARRSRIAHDQWRTNVFGPPLCWDLETVEQFDEAARHVRPEDVREAVLVSADLGRHAAWLHELAGLGFDEIYLHHVGQDLDARSSTPSASTCCRSCAA